MKVQVLLPNPPRFPNASAPQKQREPGLFMPAVHGGPDHAMSNVGTSRNGPITGLLCADWHTAFDVNLTRLDLLRPLASPEISPSGPSKPAALRFNKRRGIGETILGSCRSRLHTCLAPLSPAPAPQGNAKGQAHTSPKLPKEQSTAIMGADSSKVRVQYSARSARAQRDKFVAQQV